MYHTPTKKQDIKGEFITAHNIHHLKSVLIDIFPEYTNFIQRELCHLVDQFDISSVIYNQSEVPPMSDLVYDGNRYKQINTVTHVNAVFIQHVIDMLASQHSTSHSTTIGGNSAPYSQYPKRRIAGQGPLDTRPTKPIIKQSKTLFGQPKDYFTDDQLIRSMAGLTVSPAKSVRFANGYWREGRLKHVDREPVAYSEPDHTNDVDLMLNEWYRPSSRVDKQLKDDTSLSFDAANNSSVNPMSINRTFTKRRNVETLPANYSGDYIDGREYTIPLRDRLPDEAFVDNGREAIEDPHAMEDGEGTYDPFERSIDDRNRSMNGQCLWYDPHGKDMRHRQVRDIYRTYSPTPYRAYDLMGGDVNSDHRGPSGTQILPGEAALYNRRYESERDLANDDVTEKGYRPGGFDMSELFARCDYRSDNY